ncbi:MAG: hypothetical protein BZ138_06975, partial [Methanosphaera sp. rholeuAM270]
RAPMCGVPFHALDSYLAQLVSAGYKVAIAEQMAEPASVTKGLVPRDVIRVVTPGTVTGSGVLDEKTNNYILAAYFGARPDVAWCDLSTGEFKAKSLSAEALQDEMADVLALIGPSEIVTNAERCEQEWMWEDAESSGIMVTQANSRMSFEEGAPSLLMAYLRDTQKQDINHLGRLRVLDDATSMRLDHATLRNLELTETLFGKQTAGSLVGVLDKCKTAMGSRRLRQWVKEPLTDKSLIDERLDAVEKLSDEVFARNNLRALMVGIYDLERLVSRISLGRASVRDMLALKQSTAVLPDIKAELEGMEDVEYIRRLNSTIDDCQDIYELIEASVADPSEEQRAGRVIKAGFSDELDAVRDSVQDSLEWLDNLAATEKARTGIKNLRTGNNKVFGYYIEVP